MEEALNMPESSGIVSIKASYAIINRSKCKIKWHYNIPLGTQIELLIETRYADNDYNVEPTPEKDAHLIINNEDYFKIKYKDFIHLFMPVGLDNEIKASSSEKLADMFDFLNEESLMYILSTIGAFEVSNFILHEDDKDVVTYVRDNKLIQAGLELEEDELEEEGWTKINEYEYCYLPMSNYILWGEVDSDDLRIIIY